ncbi:unnamed protein product [Tilletia caries]|nr:unnamed protein product [Tilletia caries]
MTDLVPSRSSTSDALQVPIPSATLDPTPTNTTREEDELYAAWSDEDSSPSSTTTTVNPIAAQGEGESSSSLNEALARLDTARSPGEWWEMLRDQLDAEREEDVRARAERVSARRMASS